MSKTWQLFGVESPFDPSNRWVTSTFISPLILGLLRLLLATYAVVGIIIKLCIPTDESAGASFSYISNITYWGIAGYYSFATFHTLVFVLRGRAPLHSWPRYLQLLHVLLYSTITNFPFLITILFWVNQYQPSKLATPYLAWSNISRHALNSAYALFEVIIPRTPTQPWIHIPILLSMLGGYLGIAYITHATEGFYTYGFLDPTKTSKAKQAGLIVGAGAGDVAAFCIVWLVIWARIRLSEGPQKPRVRASSVDHNSSSLKEMPQASEEPKSIS